MRVTRLVWLGVRKLDALGRWLVTGSQLQLYLLAPRVQLCLPGKHTWMQMGPLGSAEVPASVICT